MRLSDLFRSGKPDPADALAEAARAAEAGDQDRALSLWLPLAQAGNARAQAEIGLRFAEGLGVERDDAMALRWLTLAADGGDTAGLRGLAVLHLRGIGDAPPDRMQAEAICTRAAKLGDGPAQDLLSQLLLDSVFPDPAGARHWAEAAARQGIPAAMTRLGQFHNDATGTTRDPAAAAHWWRQAAELSEPDAQAMLGAALFLGSGVAANGEEALVWLLRARAGGSALAGNFLGPVCDTLPSEAIARAEAAAGMRR